MHYAAGDLNIYRYVGNNPVNWIDPTGLTATERMALGGVSAGLLRTFSLNQLKRSFAYRFGLNATGSRYFLNAVSHNLKRLAAGKGSLGDSIALVFGGIAAVLHQSTIDAPDEKPNAGAGAGANAATGGGNNDGDDPKCKSLRAKMDRRLREINRREAALRDNYNNLPQFGPGPNAATQQGHRRIINKVWNDFRRAEKEYIRKCL